MHHKLSALDIYHCNFNSPSNYLNQINSQVPKVIIDLCSTFAMQWTTTFCFFSKKYDCLQITHNNQELERLLEGQPAQIEYALYFHISNPFLRKLLIYLRRRIMASQWISQWPLNSVNFSTNRPCLWGSCNSSLYLGRRLTFGSIAKSTILEWSITISLIISRAYFL